MLNRARMVMHELQLDTALGWDTRIPQDKLQNWSNICKQANKNPPIEIPRSVVSRDDFYDLIACTDTSKSMYGVVLYIKNLNTSVMYFLAAKNHIVNKQLESKTIPSLEFHAISLGVEVIQEYHEELAGTKILTPIKIQSLVSKLAAYIMP